VEVCNKSSDDDVITAQNTPSNQTETANTTPSNHPETSLPSQKPDVDMTSKSRPFSKRPLPPPPPPPPAKSCESTHLLNTFCCVDIALIVYTICLGALFNYFPSNSHNCSEFFCSSVLRFIFYFHLNWTFLVFLCGNFITPLGPVQKPFGRQGRKSREAEDIIDVRAESLNVHNNVPVNAYDLFFDSISLFIVSVWCSWLQLNIWFAVH
jgi:hypothetical protein